MPTNIPFEGLSVGGQRVPSADGKTAPAYDPATNEVIANVAQATPEDVDRAVWLAHERFNGGAWRGMSSRERGQLLQRIANKVREKQELLAKIESRNGGKPIGAARGEIGAVANCFEYYAGAVNKFHGQTIPVAAKGTHITFREPVGVCAAITPWNFPMLITSWKVAPALAMGNTVVIKPASATPLTALLLADCALEAGLPEGVLNVVPGPGGATGSALVQDPRVRKISFTGSTEIGAGIMQMAAPDIKRVSLELGGKSANIIFADVPDLGACVESSLFSVFDNAGQDCCSRSRFLIQRPIYDEFVEKFVARVKTMKVGDTQDPSTEMGPLITPRHRESVCRYLEIGDGEARRVVGGEIPAEGSLARGNYLSPAVYVDVTSGMRIAQEEIFGPVVAMIPFEGEEEAIRIANDSAYGLSGSLWTRDVGRVFRVVRAWQTGMISVNSSSSVHIEAPFGGMKHSGIGREQGMVALEHYSEYKSVFVAAQ